MSPCMQTMNEPDAAIINSTPACPFSNAEWCVLAVLLQTYLLLHGAFAAHMSLLLRGSL